VLDEALLPITADRMIEYHGRRLWRVARECRNSDGSCDRGRWPRWRSGRWPCLACLPSVPRGAADRSLRPL